MISVKDFKRGADLYPVLKTCTATLISFHPDITKQKGHYNAISKCIIEKAREAKITDARLSNMLIQDVLILWAGDIKTDLKEHIGISMRVKPELPQIAEGVNTLIQMVSKLVASDAKKINYVVTWQDNLHHNNQQLQPYRINMMTLVIN